MHKTSRRTGKRKEVASVLFPFHPFNLTIHTPCSCVTYAMWCYNDIKIDWNYSLAMKWHFFYQCVIWVSVWYEFPKKIHYIIIRVHLFMMATKRRGRGSQHLANGRGCFLRRWYFSDPLYVHLSICLKSKSLSFHHM